jgi:hypothetical protein
VKRILPDWLCLPNKLGGCWPLRSPPPPSLYAHGENSENPISDDLENTTFQMPLP